MQNQSIIDQCSRLFRSESLMVYLLFFVLFVFFLFQASVDSDEHAPPFYFKFTTSPVVLKHSDLTQMDPRRIYHQLLADAFIHKQLHLTVAPSPELLSLPNPYDPQLNFRYNELIDVSLYKSQFFFYFTPVVALLFIAPIKLISGYFVPENLLTALFCYVGFVYSYFILILLLKKAAISLPATSRMIAATALATATMTPSLLYSPRVYELCIAAAYAFIMMGFYYGVNTLLIKNSLIKSRLFLAGICFGLCVLSRPNQFPTCMLLIMSLISARYMSGHEKKTVLCSYILSLIAPLIIILVLMMGYNYERFDSLLEFGASFQLNSIVNMNLVHHVISSMYIPVGMFFYLFQPYSLSLLAPFIGLTIPIYIPKLGIAYPYIFHPPVGLFFLPVYVLLLCLGRIIKIRYLIPTVYILLLGLLIAGFTSMASVSIIAGCNMRYVVDFLPSLLLVALVSFFILYHQNELNGSVKWHHLPFFYSVVFMTAFISLAISADKYQGNIALSLN